MRIWAIAVCSGLLAVMPALAQPAPPASEPVPTAPTATMPPPAAPAPLPAESEDPRFSFNRVQDGYLRLDTRTGQVALCSRRQVGWACQVVPDDRMVLEADIARLQAENGTLKKELLSRGISLPGGVKPPPSSPKADDDPRAPGLSVDRVLTWAETMWYRLVEMIANLQRDIMKKS